MAKPKKPKERRPQSITPAEVQKLGDCLGTNGNIYMLARSLFNIECREEGDDEVLFNAVRKHYGSFKCELCSHWLDVSEESSSTDVCEGCLTEADSDSDD